MIKFDIDFIEYTNKILSNENFSYARYADGEVALMRGHTVGATLQAYQVDRWSAPNGLTKVGKELLETLNHTEKNYHYAISSQPDSISYYEF